MNRGFKGAGSGMGKGKRSSFGPWTWFLLTFYTFDHQLAAGGQFSSGNHSPGLWVALFVMDSKSHRRP